MKRIIWIVFLPIVLFGLEKVNLIKDAGFEKNSNKWFEVTGAEYFPDTAIANRHDAEKFFTGNYSGSCDTRITGHSLDSAVLFQGFPVVKTVSDIDSLFLRYSVIPLENHWNRSMSVDISLLLNAGTSDYQFVEYHIKAPDLSTSSPPPHDIFLAIFDFPSDTNWHSFVKGIKADLLRYDISANSKVDSFYVRGWGGNFIPWRGQKIYWDDIRLTGYADYDVGVKAILSKDSLHKDTSYMPTARIKNFGRKAADTFLVIATIEGSSGTVYADTLTWSLTADTEDTVSFKEFKPSDAASYTLTVSTIMTPDESDEDDAMSKTLYGSGIAETPSPSSLVLEVTALSSIRYSLPQGEQGIIGLYDPTGRRIESLKVKGSGEVHFKSRLTAGVYFVNIETEHSTMTRKAIVLR